MKKNISINISGIIFHIEEDGYEVLRKYLDSINRYFGAFADSSEILADIESRIAEIFLSKLNEGKQVITDEDVQSLITTMGSVNDFKAAEQQEVAEEGARQDQEQYSSASTSPRTDKAESKRLVRDQKRKILGGVCAGIGHYFNVDPIWPRLLFALLVFATTGVMILVYIILWIVLPVSEELDESKIKKMYRDPDNKVVGGVASGVAAFFGTDTTLIRVLFVVFTIFFGTGLLVYIILWIALPVARTLTDKMKMQGEPVTLSNIEISIKKGLNEKDASAESTLAKVVLFPFRMIAAMLTGIANLLGPLIKVLIDIFRIAIGFLISLTGVLMLIAMALLASVWLGMISISSLPEWSDLHKLNFPVEPLRLAFPTWTVIFALVAAAIPALFIMLLGNSIILKRIVFNAIVGWGLFVLFFASLIFLSFTIPQIIYSFKDDGEYKVEKMFITNGKQALLKVKETGMDDYKVTHLALHGYDGKDLKLVQRFESQGASKLNARENAQAVDYRVEQSDSVITFDSNIAFRKDAKFRAQRLNMELYLPYDLPFSIESDLWPMIENHWRNEFNGHNAIQQFKITPAGKLECITCPAPEKDMSGLGTNDQFGLKDFNEIDLSGVFDVVIQRGDEYAIQLEGSESQKRQYSIQKNGEILEVNYQTRSKEFWKDNFDDHDLVRFTIILPNLVKLSAKGAGKFKIRGFEEQETKISLTGAMVGDARMSSNQMSIDLTGPVVLEVDGHGEFLEASLSGTSQLRATNYPVDRAIVEARGLAQARVNVTESLEIDKDFTSNVHYTGNPHQVDINGSKKSDQN